MFKRYWKRKKIWRKQHHQFHLDALIITCLLLLISCLLLCTDIWRIFERRIVWICLPGACKSESWRLNWQPTSNERQRWGFPKRMETGKLKCHLHGRKRRLQKCQGWFWDSGREWTWPQYKSELQPYFCPFSAVLEWPHWLQLTFPLSYFAFPSPLFEFWKKLI